SSATRSPRRWLRREGGSTDGQAPPAGRSPHGPSGIHSHEGRRSRSRQPRTAKTGGRLMAKKKDRYIVGLDIGTHKVCAIVAELSEEGRLDIIGIGQTESKGLRKGVVIN